VSSFGFDLSVYDVFGVLAAGGAVRLVSTAATRDPAALWQMVTEEGITCWDSTPATLQQLTPWLTATPTRGSMRLVLLSGDWIPVPLPDQVRQGWPDAAVVALGGATEATIWSNVYPVGAVDPRWPSIPYGRPIPHARYYVLTPTLAPCPIGVRGDLYIGGAVLAIGYLGDGRQTASRFVPDPFAATPGARLYRTGDCARWQDDGQLEFLGRVDDQVKIRGYRIELGEIEAVLRERAGVRDAVVVAREDEPGQKRLVAYLLGAPCADDVRARLREWLPEYMIPAAFVAVESFPLTANGKIDRKALPAPGGERIVPGAYVEPRTVTEQLLCEIWQRVLGVARVGVEDNFFDLGGDSILSIQVAAEAREHGIQLGVQQLFHAPTVAALAELVADHRSATITVDQSPVVPLSTTGSRPPFFCVHPVGGGIGQYHDLSLHLGPEQPFYAIRAQGFSDAPTTEEARDSIEQMAARYVDAIRAVCPQPPYCLGGWSYGGVVAYEMARQLERAGVPVGLVVLLDSRIGTGVVEEGDDGTFLYRAAEELAVRAGQPMPVTYDDLLRVDPVHRREYLAEKLRPLTKMSVEAGLAMADRLMQWVRLRERMWKQYRPGPYSGHVLLFRSSDPGDGMQATADSSAPARGWDIAAQAAVDVEWVPGDHLTIVAEPHVRVLAARLAYWIDRATSEARATMPLSAG
jgi:thioesterase domain-containing protein/aryl carrier-like protein